MNNFETVFNNWILNSHVNKLLIVFETEGFRHLHENYFSAETNFIARRFEQMLLLK